MEENRSYYVYVYLDHRHLEVFRYKEWEFPYKPFYIGKGKNDRIDSHLFPSVLKPSSPKNNTIKTIRRLGDEPIRFKLYENLTEDEALDIEEDLVNYFGRANDQSGILLNLRNGGAEYTPKFRYRENPGPKDREVFQYDLSGDRIASFHSSLLAAEAIKYKSKCSLGAISSMIRLCAKGKRNQAFGFVWFYQDQGAKIHVNKTERGEIYKKKKLSPVHCLNDNREVVFSFPSVREAVREVGGGDSSIRHACNYQNRKHRGYFWRFSQTE